MKDVSDSYPDWEIIKRILNGETALFEMLIRRNNATLYKTGRSYNYSHEDTQDLMQETFIDAYRSLSKFENRSSFRTWITKIMLNNCFRKKQKFSFRFESPGNIDDHSTPMYSEHPYADSSRSVLIKELGNVIETALQQLPADYRMVFSLREINGFSTDETAEMMDISPSNVKTRLTRAKSRLRKEIEKSYVADEIFPFHLTYCDAMVNKVMEKIKAFHNPHSP